MYMDMGELVPMVLKTCKCGNTPYKVVVRHNGLTKIDLDKMIAEKEVLFQCLHQFDASFYFYWLRIDFK